MKPKLIVVSGASGSGKSTLVYYLEKELYPTPVRPLLSTTTRNPRPDDRSMYRCISEESFKLIEQGGGFLWTKNVHGCRYGTARKDLEESLRFSGCTFSIVTPDCLTKLRSSAEAAGVIEAEMLFIHVYSPGETVLRKRLLARGESQESTERRVADSRTWDDEVRKLPFPITCVENNDTEKALAERAREILEGR